MMNNDINQHPSSTPAHFLLVPYNFGIIHNGEDVHCETDFSSEGVTSIKPIHVMAFNEIEGEIKKIYPAATKITIDEQGGEYFRDENLYFSHSLAIGVEFGEKLSIYFSVDCYRTINALRWGNLA